MTHTELYHKNLSHITSLISLLKWYSVTDPIELEFAEDLRRAYATLAKWRASVVVNDRVLRFPDVWVKDKTTGGGEDGAGHGQST